MKHMIDFQQPSDGKSTGDNCYFSDVVVAKRTPIKVNKPMHDLDAKAAFPIY